MKKCNVCGATFEAGKFCGKCGSLMEEIQEKNEPILTEPKPNEKEQIEPEKLEPEKLETESLEPVQREVEQTQTENETLDKISKSGMKRGKIIALVLAIVVVVIVGFHAIYLNLSQVSIRVSSKFDEVEFENTLYDEEFDGETIDLVLPEKGVNYYLQENLKDVELADLPLGTEISDVFYKEGKIYFQLDGTFVHTTLAASLSTKVLDGKLLIEPEKVVWGKWSLPVPKGIMNMALTSPVQIELPKYLTVKDLKLDDEIEGEIILDSVYFDARIKKAFESIDFDMLSYVQSNNSNYSKIYTMYEKALKGDSEAMKTFRHDIICDEEYFVDFLAILPRDEAVQMMEQFRVDSIHYDEDEFDELFSKRDTNAEDLAKVMEAYQRERVTKAGLGLIDGYYNYMNSKAMPAYVIGYEGKPYVPSLSKFVYANDVLSSSTPDNFEYDLFYDGTYMIAGVQTEQTYYLVDEWGSIENTTKDVAYKQFNFKASSSLAQGKLLPRGDADRTSIGEVASKYIGSNNSMYIRYLKSDAEWAVLIGSDGDYPQSVYQLVLNKKGNGWTVVGEYYESELLTEKIGTDLISQGFNVSLLPTYEVADYYVWYLDYYDVDEIQSHLVDLGKVDYFDEVTYISRVDDVLAIIVGDKRFIFIFEEDSSTSYKELIEVKSGEHFSTYSYKLDSIYNGSKPTFVFVQE